MRARRLIPLLVLSITATASFASTASATQPAVKGPHALTGSKIALAFADPATGFSATTGDRLDSLVWTDSHGHPTGNLAAEGGPVQCGDPVEFMGESYGEPEGTHPGLVYAGATSTWKTLTPTSATSTTSGTTCTGSEDARTVTTYSVFTTKAQSNEFEVARTFKFSKATPLFNGHGFRPYVPRLPASTYHIVLWPNAAGTALNSLDVGSCGGDCEQSDWNQRWFADDSGSGSGMIVIRAATSTAKALLTVNNDSSSASNLSSVVLIQPAHGWTAPVKETEYLCFYDPASWPAARRSALKLPTTCQT